MNNKKQVLRVIFKVIDEINQLLPEDGQMKKSIDTDLFGRSGKLDSMGLVTLIVTTEQKIEEELGVSITIADERAMSQKNSPFKTIGTLAEYTLLLLEENANG